MSYSYDILLMMTYCKIVGCTNENEHRKNQGNEMRRWVFICNFFIYVYGRDKEHFLRRFLFIASCYCTNLKKENNNPDPARAFFRLSISKLARLVKKRASKSSRCDAL